MLLWPEQFEIIKQRATELLRREGKGYSFQTLADLLSVGRGKVQAWEKGQRPSAEDLAAMSKVLGFSADWLLLGKGAVEGGEQLGQKHNFTATNAKKQLIGDLLHDMLGVLQVDQLEFAKKLNISNEQAEDILSSRRHPSWDELLRMHQKLHIDIHFLLTGEGASFAPYDEFTRLCSATKIDPWDYFQLATACGCDYDDMLSWLSKRKKKPGIIFPHEWVRALVENYSINPGWLYHGTGQSHLTQDDARSYRGRNTGYSVRESKSQTQKVAENKEAYVAPKKAAGDDTV